MAGQGGPDIHFMVCPQASPADTRFTIMSQLRLDWPSKGRFGFFNFFLLLFFSNCIFAVCT